MKTSTTNPVLIAARETWDKGDTFGSTMCWLIALQDHEAYDETPDMDNQIEYETRVLVSLRTGDGEWSLRTGDGEWSLPQATEEDILEAERVMDRLYDVCKASGLDY